MLDKKLSHIGLIEIHSDGSVGLIDFDADGVSCRELACLAMLHGIGVLQQNLADAVREPGGGNSYID